MNLLDCFSYLKCCGNNTHPIIEIDEIDCCNNCCRDKRKRFKCFKTRTLAYLRRYASY